MQQHLIRWDVPLTGDSSDPQPTMMSLTITDDGVVAVLGIQNVEAEPDPGQEPDLSQIEPWSAGPLIRPARSVEKFNALMLRSQGQPAMPASGVFAAQTIDPQFMEDRMELSAILRLQRDGGFLGSMERSGPSVICFQMEGGVPHYPFNLLSQTVNSKRDSRFAKQPNQRETPLMMYLAHPDLPFTQATFVVRQPEGSQFACNLSGWREVDASPHEALRSVLPGVLFDSPALQIHPGMTAEVGFSIRFPDGDLDLSDANEALFESTGGYLPIRRSVTQSGIGNMRVSALGLVAGDKFKVKAGFKNYSGTDELLVEVV